MSVRISHNTLRAKLSGAVYCNRPYLWVCLFLCVFVGLLPRQLEIVSIDPHQTGFIGKGSNHLQLIKGSAAGRKFLAPPYYSQRAVFAPPLSAFSLSQRRTLGIAGISYRPVLSPPTNSVQALKELN